MRVWLIIIAAGVVTYGIRLSMLALVHHSTLPRTARDALRFVTPAVLCAIILPAVLFVGSDQHFSVANERVAAGLIAAAIAYLAKNVWLTIGAGMAALWVLQAMT